MTQRKQAEKARMQFCERMKRFCSAKAKAWIVGVVYYDETEIRYGETAGKVISSAIKGADWIDFLDVKVRRAPKVDLLGKGVKPVISKEELQVLQHTVGFWKRQSDGFHRNYFKAGPPELTENATPSAKGGCLYFVDKEVGNV